VVFLLYTDFSTEAAEEKLALQKQQIPWRSLYRGGKPLEDGCMKPKHVV
jgi:hypothetical protein